MSGQTCLDYVIDQVSRGDNTKNTSEYQGDKSYISATALTMQSNVIGSGYLYFGIFFLYLGGNPFSVFDHLKACYLSLSKTYLMPKLTYYINHCTQKSIMWDRHAFKKNVFFFTQVFIFVLLDQYRSELNISNVTLSILYIFSCTGGGGSVIATLKG